MIDELHDFAVIVEQESLNKASQLLNISQPALSRKIMKLEEQLGITLFERKGKRLELTRIGRTCYEYAVEFRDLHNRMQRTLSAYHSTGKSNITIGASLTTLQSTLPDLIGLYTKDYPDTDIKALTGKTHEIVLMVKEKKVDIGLVASKIDHPGLNCVPLFDDHLCLVLPNGHKLVNHQQIAMNDLHELPMILFSKGTWYRILMDELFQKYVVLPDVKMEIDSFEAIMRLVSTTQVATLLPKSYLRSNLIRDNELVVRELTELAQTKRTTSLIFTDTDDLSASAQQMINKAKHFFGSCGESN